jgi:hypothetical protein
MQLDRARADDGVMPGPIHEGLVALFAKYPGLPVQLAARCGARLHGSHRELRASPTVFQDPGNPGRQFHADWVTVGWAEVKGELVAVDAVVIEIQLEHDPLKVVSWVVYRAGVRSRHRCRGWTLVLCLDSKVRERGRALFDAEPELCPLFITPEMIPPIVNVFEARRNPGMAILAAVVHARTEAAVASARAALMVVARLPRWERECYQALVTACLTEEQMSEVTRELPKDAVPKLSAFEREGWGFTWGRREGLEEGLEQGREEARREVFHSLAEMLLATLARRGVELSARQRSRVSTCEDLECLSRWLMRAATATSADELFATPA